MSEERSKPEKEEQDRDRDRELSGEEHQQQQQQQQHQEAEAAANPQSSVSAQWPGHRVSPCQDIRVASHVSAEVILGNGY
ncbi:hypothetical protein KQX54_005033 [Cotesia glomerata]|uniref:Uncharacterized protein n=1 Tax=Cotesia glomerata TaxID=32391 RepID=A0AAV7I0A7_COTGL|nr:hypothetical protein KQX54_005033 [Cotesia glomerata]